MCQKYLIIAHSSHVLGQWYAGDALRPPESNFYSNGAYQFNSNNFVLQLF